MTLAQLNALCDQCMRRPWNELYGSRKGIYVCLCTRCYLEERKAHASDVKFLKALGLR